MMRGRTRLALAALLAPLLTLFPRSALACAVCLGGISDKVLHAYYESVVILLLLPLVMVGVIFLVARSNRNRVEPPPHENVEAFVTNPD